MSTSRKCGLCADLALLNGRVLTVDAEDSVAEAVALAVYASEQAPPPPSRPIARTI